MSPGLPGRNQLASTLMIACVTAWSMQSCAFGLPADSVGWEIQKSTWEIAAAARPGPMPTAQDQPPASPDDSLEIVVLEGEGAINNLRQRIVRDPVVRVEDRNRKPVAGAAVTFALPNQGAGGVFANGSRTLTVITDNQGQAVARGFKPSNPGNFEIRVSASQNGRTGRTTIHQTNALVGAAAAGLSLKLLLLILGAGAAAAAGGIYAATSGGGGTTPAGTVGLTQPIGIAPGTPVVGPPH